ncbi:hypothetical protein V6Z90_006174 [Aspergillus fumigatus]
MFLLDFQPEFLVMYVMNHTKPTNPGEEREDTALSKSVIICFIIFYTLIGILVTLRLWDRVQYPYLTCTTVDCPNMFTATPKRRLEHLDEAAPVKSLQQWQASWCSEESPLLSKDDPLTCTICLEEVLTTQPVHCLGCRHVLHCWCLEKWFLRFHNTCPVCHRTICSDETVDIV